MTIRLLLAGDLITGRGIDQVLPHPGDPAIYEDWRKVNDARFYVRHAVRKNGRLPGKRDFDYIWGNLLPELDSYGIDLRIVNLETAVTTESTPWPDKMIHFKMNPANAPALTAGKIDCCTLANNHVLDWGMAGLKETMETLRGAGIRWTGAGTGRAEAEAPTIMATKGSRVLLFGMATSDTAIPPSWDAATASPGINLVERNRAFVERLGTLSARHRRPGDIVVASIHWGGNLVKTLPQEDRQLAHALIDEAGIDVVHGHSSHHVREVEVYRGKLILYGCGDALNDFEGIGLYPDMRPELGLLYLADIEPDGGRLRALSMVPTRIRQLRMNRAGPPGTQWLQRTLNRRGRSVGTGVTVERGLLRLRWRERPDP